MQRWQNSNICYMHSQRWNNLFAAFENTFIKIGSLWKFRHLCCISTILEYQVPVLFYFSTPYKDAVHTIVASMLVLVYTKAIFIQCLQGDAMKSQLNEYKHFFTNTVSHEYLFIINPSSFAEMFVVGLFSVCDYRQDDRCIKHRQWFNTYITMGNQSKISIM